MEMTCVDKCEVKKTCTRCSNLVQNPSFEAGLSGWVTDNVQLNSRLSIEGTQAAVMQEGLASMYQDVRLTGAAKGPLLLSFSLLADYGSAENPMGGNLIAEVIWQDGGGFPVGTGLRLFIPGTMLAITDNILTYIEVTDEPPVNARSVRLQFSKSEFMPGQTSLIIDNIILASLQDINLVINSGFQEMLFGWDNANAGANGNRSYEGTIHAVVGVGGVGSVSQDIPIGNQPANSSFPLSYAVNNINSIPLSVTLEYRNSDGPLGVGLSLVIPPFAPTERTWKTYAVATQTAAPAGATIARVSFNGTESDVDILVDKVTLTRVETPNLILNPSFEAGLSNWNSQNVAVNNISDIFEGALQLKYM